MVGTTAGTEERTVTEQVVDPAWKPDFEEARRRWAAFWAGEMIDRPLVMIRCPKPGAPKVHGPRYMAGRDGRYDDAIDAYVAWAETVVWGGEAIPSYAPSIGPDMFAGFLGATINYGNAQETGTSWVEPFVESWDTSLPLLLDEANPVWTRMREFTGRLAEAGRGRFVVGHLDMHSGFDALAAIRTPDRLCMDLLDCPEQIDRAMADVRRVYPLVDERLRQLGRMHQTGSSSWIPMYCEGKYNVTQCDFSCMVGPEHFRRWVLPALEDELAHLDHSIYHLDGVGALVHLDDLLSLERLDAIQWVQGAGKPPHREWIDLFKRITAAGKSVVVYCSPGEIPLFHKELDPRKVFYDTWAKDEAELHRTLEWLTNNT